MSTDSIVIVVPGTPRPQGSKTIGRDRRTGRPIILEGRTGSQRRLFTAWRNAVRQAAVDQLRLLRRTTALSGPVAVHITFVHPRPKSTPKAARWRSVRPDVDKLARAALDPLQAAGVFGDDAQVAELLVRKVIAVADEYAGAVIIVHRLDHATAPASLAEYLPAESTREP